MDDITSTKNVFSRIALLYTLFSAVANFLQVAVIYGLQYINPKLVTMNVQVAFSTGVLYVSGMLILGFGFRVLRFPVAVITEKKRMSVSAFFKAFLMCYALMFVSNMVGMMFTTVIGAWMGRPVTNPVEELTMSVDLPVLVLFTVILAPIFEELLFRKFIVDRTVQYGETASMLFSGLIFGLVHGNLSQFPYAFALGAFFAYIYIRTGRIGYSMLLHAGINFLGSIAGTILLKNIDLSIYEKLFQGASLDAMMQLLNGEALRDIILLFVYELAVMLLVVIGLILWILEFKKIFFRPAVQPIPKGRVAETCICNVGMLLYSAFWIIMIILSL